MSVGPIQIAVFEFESNKNFEGRILDELKAVRSTGILKLLDLQFVMKYDNGELAVIELSDLSEEEEIEYGILIGAMMGMGAAGEEGAIAGAIAGAELIASDAHGLTIPDVHELADHIQPGTSACVMMIEHTWAKGLKSAMQDAGGRMVAQGFLTPDALFMIGKEVEAILEAEAVIEEAEAIKGAAILDAMITIAEAAAIEEEAIEDAAAAVIVAEAVEDYAADQAASALAAANAIKTLAAAEVLQTLIAAEMIEEAAIQEALDVLVAAEIIETNAMERAALVAAEAEA